MSIADNMEVVGDLEKRGFNGVVGATETDRCKSVETILLRSFAIKGSKV